MPIISWPDGLVRGPDGIARQVPTKHVWASAVWCTKDGACRRRHFNTVTQRWHWDTNTLQLTEDEGGITGYHIAPWFISIERAIASAWCLRDEMSSYTIHNARPAEAIHAKHLSWDVPGRHAKEGAAIDGAETWHPMEGAYSWRCGVVSCRDAGYAISNHGRLKSPSGEITSGFYFDGRRWAAVKECGLVDLTTCARLRKNVIYLPPSIKHAANALGSGHTPSDLAHASGVQLGTAWSYFTRAAQHMDARTLSRVVPPLVGPRIWAVLSNMRQARDARLGGTLVDLMEACAEALPGGVARDHPMSKLRLARLAVVARM